MWSLRPWCFAFIEGPLSLFLNVPKGTHPSVLCDGSHGIRLQQGHPEQIQALSSWISQDELSHMTVLEEGTCGWDKLQLLIERPGHETGCLQMTLLGQLGIAERKESQWDYFNPLWMQMIPSPPATKSHCQSSPHRHLFSRGWGVCLSLFEINSLGCRGQTLVSVSASCLSIL